MSKVYTFQAIVLRMEETLRQHYIEVPPKVAESIGAKRVLLIVGEREFRRAIQGRKNGRKVILMGQPLLKEIGARKGYQIKVKLKADPEPDKVDLGEEFEEVLAQDELAAKRFYSFTPGKQRSLAYYITSAKRVDTRIKRALEIAHKLKTRSLYGDRE